MSTTPPEPRPVAYTTWKYHTDPEFKEKWNKQRVERQKKLFEENPEAHELHKKKVSERNKERYHSDPAYREYILQKTREFRARKKQEKLATSPKTT